MTQWFETQYAVILKDEKQPDIFCNMGTESN